MKLFHYPPAASNLLPVGVVNVTGAGDRCGVQFDVKCSVFHFAIFSSLGIRIFMQN